ncbi:MULTISPECIES: DNA/RNA non-specific endonuclease [unclassified Acinetobacter]|uniref:DNA/RNA non-specific endonuclease n=1 Tax=unclassified Acinetobacter TaxID=196816 RepID=UPI0035B7E468
MIQQNQHKIKKHYLSIIAVTILLSGCTLDSVDLSSIKNEINNATADIQNTGIGHNSGNSNQADLFNQRCLSQFYADTAPELINNKLKKQTYPLCFNGFNVMYSGVSRTPLWVAEKLTPQRLSQKLKREDSFHEETRLPASVRSTLADYRSSGFDRGHMAPNGDMYDKNSQFDSFSLANITPQHPVNNQNTWREIEEATRTLVTRYKEDAYVITGSAYLDATVRAIKPNSQVLVPSHVYKAVYLPKSGIISAYLSKNDDSRTAEVLSICQLEKRIGISLYPQVSNQLKSQRYDLPLTANQVRANRIVSLVENTKMSDCLPSVSEAQIKATQQQFTAKNAKTDGLSTDKILKLVSNEPERNHQQPLKDQVKQELKISLLEWLRDKV